MIDKKLTMKQEQNSEHLKTMPFWKECRNCKYHQYWMTDGSGYPYFYCELEYLEKMKIEGAKENESKYESFKFLHEKCRNFQFSNEALRKQNK